MEAQSWIIGQIIIDIFIAALIMWFIRSHFKGRRPWNDTETAFRESDSILSEMKELSLQLDRNLKEKKELSRKILDQLDEGLQKAEDTFQQIQKITKRLGTSMAHVSDSAKDNNRIKSSVNALLAKGLSREEIAQHLGISVAEIELLVKLQSQAEGPKSPDIK